MTLLSTKRWSIWTHLAVLGLALGTFTIYVADQLSNKLADPDAFYHMKMAQLIWEHKSLVFSFPWLPLTTFSQNFIDQHVLLHVVMIPFVVTGAPFVGAKLLTAILASAVIVGLGLLCRALGLRWWLPVSIILALTVTFTFRINLVKATQLSLLLLFAAIWCLHKKKYLWLAILAFVYVWSYGGFEVLGIIAITWLISDCLANIKQLKYQWWAILKPFGVILLGLIAGIIINPYFPTNLAFYWDQFVQIGVINYHNIIKVGGEWYPYPPGDLIFSSVLLITILFTGVVSIVQKKHKLSQLDWFALGLLLVGSILTFKSRRYVEYWGPFTAIAAAIWLNHIHITRQQFMHWLNGKLWPVLGYTLLVSALLVQIIPIVLHDIKQNMHDVRGSITITQYQQASEWLAQNTPKGSVVLHSDWDIFPSLFYYNTNNIYMIGLDPTFMYRYNPDLYWTWVHITTGEYQGNLLAAFKKLHAQYILVQHGHDAMYKLVSKNPHVQHVYHDDEADVFQVIY